MGKAFKAEEMPVVKAGRGDSAQDVQMKKTAGVRETGRQVT